MRILGGPMIGSVKPKRARLTKLGVSRRRKDEDLKMEYGLSPLIRLDAPLPFNGEDFKKYPWLKEKDRYYRLVEKLGRGGFSIAYKGWACDKNGDRWAGSPDLVFKIPNLDGGRSSTDIGD